MTYENAAQWCIDNVPMYAYDSFAEWYNHCVSNELMGGDALRGYREFNELMEKAWIDVFGDLDSSPNSREFEDTTEKELAKQEQELRDLGIYEQTSRQTTNDYISGTGTEEITYTRVAPIRVSGLPEFREEYLDVPTLPKESSIPVEYRQEIQTPELPHEPVRQEPIKKKNIVSRFFGGIRQRLRGI